MFVGDSITAGVGSTDTGGFRGPLMDSIRNRMAGKIVNFVGSDVNYINRRMCGTSGLTVSEIAASRYLGKQVAQYKPNVIFLHIGTNDCTQLHSGLPGHATLEQSMASYQTILTNIETNSPQSMLFACKIIDNSSAHTEVVAYNAALETVLQDSEHYQNGKVKIVDMYTYMGSYSATNYADGTHPNLTGYYLMSSGYQTDFNLYY